MNGLKYQEELERLIKERDIMAKKNEAKGRVNEETGEWEEAGESTGGTRWWAPDHDDAKHVLICQIEERGARATRYGERGYFLVTATEKCVDKGGPIESGDKLIVWESAGLRDLMNFVGKEVRIVANDRQGRMKTYKFSQRRRAS